VSVTRVTERAGLRLAGQRAIVTGAASGIGLAIARKLLGEGVRVALSDLRDDALADACRDLGSDARGFPCDVGDESSVSRMIDEAGAWLGGLDTVVTSAGIVRSGSTVDLSLETWELVLRINLTGTFLVLKHCLGPLRRNGGGSIITVGSVSSLVAAGRTCAYDAAKGGVLQLTRAIAVENAPHGIRANCVLPGIVRTPLAANSIQLYGEMDTNVLGLPATRVKIPMERVADPAEIAGVVAFLASSEASFMTGAAIAVDGGYTAI
jgi:NAD(P)-dependent dehydrogenase (short-subunit alcohol dehydrogenase family)